ncbi:MAG: hypothetical protein ACKV2U_08580 [Bryobacteraceae bacterium]
MDASTNVELTEDDDGTEETIAAAVVPIPVISLPPNPDGLVASAVANGELIQGQQKIIPGAEPQAAASAIHSDKGEVIWAAELVVTEIVPEQGSELSAEALAGARRDKGAEGAAIAMKPGDAGSQRQATEERNRDKREEGSSSHKTAEAELVEPEIGETSSSSSEQFQGPVSEITRQGSAPVESRAKTAVAAIGSIDPADIARPLRPTQISTLYVDVPAPAGQEGSASMRLAVSQRGDQVNVQLRSWDSAATPLGNDRMQPLLQSLAEKGYSSSGESADRIDESGPILAENVREKPLATAETAGGGNEQNAFQPPDERQQKNQERQQQAVFLRKRMRTVQSGEFDPRSVLEPNNSSFQQGAPR